MTGQGMPRTVFAFLLGLGVGLTIGVGATLTLLTMAEARKLPDSILLP